MTGLIERLKGFGTWLDKSIVYRGERNLLYDVKIKGTNKDADKAIRKFGEDLVLPELIIYLETCAGKFEKNYEGAMWARKEWNCEPRTIKGEDNPRYDMKVERKKYFEERAAKHETGQLLHESLWGILNTEGYKGYSEAKKLNQDIINTLPRIQ